MFLASEEVSGCDPGEGEGGTGGVNEKKEFLAVLYYNSRKTRNEDEKHHDDQTDHLGTRRSSWGSHPIDLIIFARFILVR